MRQSLAESVLVWEGGRVRALNYLEFLRRYREDEVARVALGPAKEFLISLNDHPDRFSRAAETIRTLVPQLAEETNMKPSVPSMVPKECLIGAAAPQNLGR
jgi:hypothetical protein